jgi:hypothetical protein
MQALSRDKHVFKPCCSLRRGSNYVLVELSVLYSFSCLCVCPILFSLPSLGTRICGTAVCSVAVDFTPFPLFSALVFTYQPSPMSLSTSFLSLQSVLTFAGPFSATTINDVRPFSPILLFSPHLYLRRLPLLRLLEKLQCLDTTPRNRLCPLLVIPLVPCKLIFRLMV